MIIAKTQLYILTSYAARISDSSIIYATILVHKCRVFVDLYVFIFSYAP